MCVVSAHPQVVQLVPLSLEGRLQLPQKSGVPNKVQTWTRRLVV
jgi:hypothetical protein